MMNLRGVFSNSIVQLFSSRMIIQISTILQSIIIARVLGPEGKGYYTEVMIYPTMVGALASVGLYTGIIRLAAKKRIHERFNITKAALRTTGVFGIIGAVIAGIINGFYFTPKDSFYTCAVIYGIYVLIYVVNRGLSAYNTGIGNLKLFSISSAILYPTYFLIILILLIFNAVTVSTALYGLLAANFASLVFLWMKNTERKEPKPSFPPQRLVKHSIKYSVADLSEPIYLYYDKAVLAAVLSPTAFGLYTIASSSASLINIFSNTFSIKLFSDIAKNDKSNLVRTLKANIILMIFAAMVLGLLLPVLIPLFYGNAYMESILPALILLITCIVQGQSFILERSILADGKAFVGITAKIIGVVAFGGIMLLLYKLNYASLSLTAAASVTTSLLYFIYIFHKAKTIFNITGSVLPTVKDISDLFSKIAHPNSK